MVTALSLVLRLSPLAPVVVHAPPVAPALSSTLLSAPAASAPSLTPSPIPFSPAPLDLSRAAGVYERRGVGLLVLDAKDSTSLHLSEGSRRAHAMIRDVVDGAESAASAFDGVVIRRLGDGSLLAFPSYAAALGAAEAIQARAAQTTPKLRVGVHVGRVLVDATGDAPEIYGRSVEKALALAASADGGEIAAEDGLNVKAAPPTRAPDAPRPVDFVGVVNAATMFVGLEGWTTAYERYGRRRSYAAVKTFHAYVRAAVERHGGLVVKTEGETVMASFPTAEAGVKAAAEIQGRIADLRVAAPLGRLFRARVGLSWGRVIREERSGELDFFGNTVNAAARLMKLSGDGEALISGTAAGQPGVASLLKSAVHETTSMKGFSGATPVFRLIPSAMPRDVAASALLRETALKARRAIVPAPDVK
ncbi:MAG: adenylate/guanylate cyclase domain-containing protein [Elusimicrobiota bacterium]